MKNKLSVILVIVLCVAVLAGCANQGTTPRQNVTETVEVLYVESAGFIAELSAGICYIEYPNADNTVSVGDQVELTYDEINLLAAVPDKELGGYQWRGVLTDVKSLQVK